MLEHDEYDDDFADFPPSSSSKKRDKQVRRRSSKACDQCRKSKCKCERSGSRDTEPCKNCILLATPCTFLGPSRKRGPPKGYIDAIESRLHHMEALLGTLMSSHDSRIRSVVRDLSEDPLVREILDRVDESPFGTRSGTADGGMEDRASRILRTTSSQGSTPMPYPNPSVEWQAHLNALLEKGARYNGNKTEAPPSLSLDTNLDLPRERQRQRRRISPSSSSLSPHHLQATSAHQLSSQSQSQSRPLPAATHPNHPYLHALSPTSSPSSSPSSSSSSLLASAVGQLSLNEESQLRYHGEVSGLHILGMSDRRDKRNEGGLWRFPRAGVWPRASRMELDGGGVGAGEEVLRQLGRDEQEQLLRLYFSYVHPVLPLMLPDVFWREFRGEAPSHSPPSLQPLSTFPAPTVSPLLLLSMFAIAARYKSEPAEPLPLNEGDMWNAGDGYLEGARRILNQTYASSRPSTCQALLLLSYREVGIGAMAQAWLYVGMAVRMAQDLGLHRSADRWSRTGSELFSEEERQVRKRIWFSCVIMDKYVSTYIGRPLSIFERDFDTPYPVEDPKEENDLWLRDSSPCAGEAISDTELPSSYVPVPGRIMTCFNASARLSGILSNIVESIYVIQPPPSHSRHAESVKLEKKLDMWYLGLPECLRLPRSGQKSLPLPPPHVLTLHMQYWCSVLLLHRPFINVRRKATAEDPDDPASRKSFDLCAMAATKISNIVRLYKLNFCIKRSPAFLTYYVFSAGIMHMTTLSMPPSDDVQALLGLQTCMETLQSMSTLWPSAGRAWELLYGAKIDMHEIERSRLEGRDKRKRDPEEEPEEDVKGKVGGSCVDVSGNADVPINMGMGMPMQLTAPVHPQQQQQCQQQYQPQSHGALSDAHSHHQRHPEQHADLQPMTLPQSHPQPYAEPQSYHWTPQDGFTYPAHTNQMYVDARNYDSFKGSDPWKGFPNHFEVNDPSLITSSLYGLPVMSGPSSAPFVGDLSSMYSE
ncbi:fungal-specific transcription factor domain-containing protein [Hysterangium stoloniferum]|nr:fungal-specific transcription factor domain-containing protein [Hysterangium stoloniferum]